MFRTGFILAFICLASVDLVSPLNAETVTTSNTATATVTIPVAKEDPEIARQRKLDQLLGTLHRAPKTQDVSRIDAEIWEIWSRNSSPTAEVLLRESSAAISASDFNPAEKILSQLLETYPNFGEGWNRRGALYYLLGRYDAALIDIGHALAIEPRNYGAWVGKGMVLHAQKKNVEAVAAFNEALAINPHLDAVTALIKAMDAQEPHV